jgi:hypothetical protein
LIFAEDVAELLVNGDLDIQVIWLRSSLNSSSTAGATGGLQVAKEWGETNDGEEVFVWYHPVPVFNFGVANLQSCGYSSLDFSISSIFEDLSSVSKMGRAFPSGMVLC